MYIDLSGEWNILLMAEEGMQSGKILLPGILQACGYGNPITRQTPWVSSLHDSFWYEQEEYKYGQEDGVNVPFLAQPPKHFLGPAVYERSFVIPGEGHVSVGEAAFPPEGKSCREWHFYIEATKWLSQVWIDGNFQGEDCSLCSPHDIRIRELKPGPHTIRVVIDNSMLYPYRPDAHSVSDALGGSWNGMVGEIALFTEEEHNRRKMERREYADSHPTRVCVAGNQIMVDGKPVYFRATHFGGDFPLTGHPAMEKAWWQKKMAVIKQWGLNGIRFHSYCPPEAAFAAADEEGIYLLVECGMWNHFEEPGIGLSGAGEGQKETSMYSLLKRESERILDYFGHHPSFVFFSSSNEPGGAWYKPLRKWVSEVKKYDESLGYGGRRAYTAQSGWFYDVPPAEIEGTDFIYFHRSGYGPYLGGTIRNPLGWRGGNYSPSLEGVKKPVFCHELGQICAYPDYAVAEKFTGYLQPGNYKVFRENARVNGILPYAEEFVRCSGENQLRLYKEELEANFRTPEIQGFELLDLHDYLGQGTALVGILDPFWESKGYGNPAEFRQFCGDTVLLAGCRGYVWKDSDTAVIPVEICHYGEEDIRGGVVYWKLSALSGQFASREAEGQPGGTGSVFRESDTVRCKALHGEEIGLGAQDEELPVLCGGGLPVEEIPRGGNTKAGEITLHFGEILRDALKDCGCQEDVLCHAMKLELLLWQAADASGEKRVVTHNSWDLYVFRKPSEGHAVGNAFHGQAPSCDKKDCSSGEFVDRRAGLETTCKAEDAFVMQCKSDSVPSRMRRVLYTRDWAEAKAALEAGRKVVFSPYLSDLNYECPPLSARSVNWNAQMGPSWCRTMGVVIDEQHPIFRYFPTGHSGGWQWEDILTNARGFHMEGLEQIKPIVQPVDDWNRNLLQSLLFEARVLKGSLLLVSANLEGSFEERPAAYSLKEAILRYAASELFFPKAEAGVEEIEGKLFPTLRMEALTKKISYMEDIGVSGALCEIKHADAIVTADPNTSARIEAEEFPVSVTVTLRKPVEIQGILYVPEQRDRQHEGFARDYSLEVHDCENGSWERAAEGVFRNTCRSQRVLLDRKIVGDAIHLTIYSAYGYEMRRASIQGDEMQSASAQGDEMQSVSAQGGAGTAGQLCQERPGRTKHMWLETERGWYRRPVPVKAVVQTGGIHILCDEAAPHSDFILTGAQASRTKEIEP